MRGAEFVRWPMVRLSVVNPLANSPTELTDFRSIAMLGVGFAALLLLTPFSIINFSQDRPLLGAGALLVLTMAGVNAWMTLRGRYYPALAFWGLVPPTLFFLGLSIQTQQVIGILWCYPAMICYFGILPERTAWAAAAALVAVASFQALHFVEPAIAVRAVVTLVCVSVFSMIYVRIISNQHRQLAKLATIDPLSGLSNPLLLASSLERVAHQCRRTNTELSVVTIHIDHFRSINDTYGSDEGDLVLKGMGELIAEQTGGSDHAFRIGGEEFLLVLYDTGTDASWQVSERIRVAIESAPLLSAGRVTASIGFAQLKDGEDWRRLVRRSSDFAHRAKSQGRNRVYPAQSKRPQAEGERSTA